MKSKGSHSHYLLSYKCEACRGPAGASAWTQTAERAWRKDAAESVRILQDLASRAILLDVEQPDGTVLYMLPPPMAGFFEFSLMRVRGDLDQKVLSELYYQYLTVEEAFLTDLMARPETNVGRAFVNEAALRMQEGQEMRSMGQVQPGLAAESPDIDRTMHVLDYERASHVIRTASHIGISMCYCRHKMQHLSTACDAPMDICMTFGGTASSLIKHGHARGVGEVEGMKLL